jgi:hypothetical protein
MTTLHIEHAISDLHLWQAAFARFAEVRARSGVRAHRIQQPVDDPNYVVLDLDFDTPEEASHFLSYLRKNVWSSPDSSPALVGAPKAQILQSATAA